MNLKKIIQIFKDIKLNIVISLKIFFKFRNGYGNTLLHHENLGSVCQLYHMFILSSSIFLISFHSIYHVLFKNNNNSRARRQFYMNLETYIIPCSWIQYLQ